MHLGLYIVLLNIIFLDKSNFLGITCNVISFKFREQHTRCIVCYVLSMNVKNYKRGYGKSK